MTTSPINNRGSMTPTRDTSALKVIAVGFLIFAAAFFAVSAPLYWKQYRVLKTWRRADAEVVSSRVIALTTRSGEKLYDAEYTFAFAADGDPRLATAFSNHQSTSRERKQKQVERFPPGLHTVVLYNPADPSEVRMQPGYNVHFFAVPLFVSGLGAIPAVFALICWPVAGVLRRRRRNAVNVVS